jgi:nucleotide-binding universal stress UspA family protein
MDATPRQQVQEQQVRTQRWIVGMDGSEDALTALKWAVGAAAAQNASGQQVKIRAVSAWNMPITAPVGVAGASVLVDWADVDQAVAERLEQLVASIDHHDVEIETAVEVGGATRVLMAEAESADLLIVGSRGLAGFKELVLGSVSRQCATHAPVPTAVVPAHAPIGATRRIVVGFDESDNAAAAVRWALDWAAQMDHRPEIDVVSAFEISPLTDPELTRLRFPDEVAEAEQQFHRAVDALDPTRTMRRQFSLRGARWALAETAAGADLVVLGARGRGAIGAALLGSVSTWMLHNTQCTLVVVPAEDRSVANEGDR